MSIYSIFRRYRSRKQERYDRQVRLVEAQFKINRELEAKLAANDELFATIGVDYERLEKKHAKQASRIQRLVKRIEEQEAIIGKLNRKTQANQPALAD